MKDLKDFFLLCAGTDPNILKRSPIDVNKQIGIGATVLFTAVFASIAAAYALNFVFDSLWMAIPFGILWGLMIFNLDRYIVSSIRNRGSLMRRLWMVLPRLAVAVIIAIVIAAPLEMKLFEKEINAELTVINQEVAERQDEALKNRFASKREQLKTEEQALNLRLEESLERVDALEQAAIAEADGTGGSQRRNMGPIYKTKKAAADKAASEHMILKSELSPRLTDIQEQLNGLDSDEKSALENMERSDFGGIAGRLVALDRLSVDNPKIHTAHTFIFLLFLLIECTPIMVKLMSEKGSYDKHLHVHEQLTELYHKEVTTLRSSALEDRLRYENEVGEAQISARIQLERAKIKKDLEDQLKSIRGESGEFENI